jgi:hypothetical protein
VAVLVGLVRKANLGSSYRATDGQCRASVSEDRQPGTEITDRQSGSRSELLFHRKPSSQLEQFGFD